MRAKYIGKDILAGLRNIVGGEVSQYTDLLKDAREEAYARMVAESESKNADAVVCVRMVTSMVSQMAAELMVYGTAVKLNNE